MVTKREAEAILLANALYPESGLERPPPLGYKVTELRNSARSIGLTANRIHVYGVLFYSPEMNFRAAWDGP